MPDAMGNAITWRRPRSLGRDETRGNKGEYVVRVEISPVKRKERKKGKK